MGLEISFERTALSTMVPPLVEFFIKILAGILSDRITFINVICSFFIIFVVIIPLIFVHLLKTSKEGMKQSTNVTVTPSYILFFVL